ncbi:endolytic transglycosylase MltG [Brachybacterium sp. SGAir0954]|uniref:endolytic transglycosylase MltG n=1 Tax=Brachybacterium sp. SGAir0954 TaxID=2571029 RepID=UPI0010CCB732|nr:endolytic transglycosylase MltG [Brachybacterium sp. SGAir0954]QCR54014.1 endolytic transglycosylase MltG [Brachybacterium sp. SGAir0954]
MSEGQGEDDSVSFDELAESQNARDEDASTGHGRRRAAGPVRRRRRRGPLRRALPVLLVLLVLGGLGVGGVYGYQWLTSNVSLEQEDPDFPGPGSGEALVQVAEGDTGTDIAKTLVDAGVIKTTGPFITQFSNSPDASGIEPGLYRLKKGMTSSDALTMILDPANVAGHRVIVPEGLRAEKIWAVLSEATDIPVEDFEAAAKDYTSFGVPENDAKSLEGYLWPGRYDVPEDATAGEVISMMTDRMQTELEKLGVAPEDEHRVLTLASIAEKEARDPDDYGRVVRTLENRLEGVGEAKGKPMKLQLDSTVAYFTGSDTISTTPAQRKQDSPYNTYLHEGLPVGPISNPGKATIQAAIDPPEGDWLYWVTVNTDTGETKFAATYSEHEKNVQEWRDWYDAKQGG